MRVETKVRRSVLGRRLLMGVSAVALAAAMATGTADKAFAEECWTDFFGTDGALGILGGFACGPDAFAAGPATTAVGTEAVAVGVGATAIGDSASAFLVLGSTAVGADANADTLVTAFGDAGASGSGLANIALDSDDTSLGGDLLAHQGGLDPREEAFEPPDQLRLGDAPLRLGRLLARQRQEDLGELLAQIG